MAYAKAVTKITFVPYSKGSIQEAMSWAWKCDINCFCFNGDIYICANKDIAGKRYLKSPFTIQDFEI